MLSADSSSAVDLICYEMVPECPEAAAHSLTYLVT